jgi:DNA-binding NtrC family response regulator
MGSTATVLLVDDEPQVRQLVRRLLEEASSCSVLEAEDGDTALVAVERDDPPLDLVLTDLNMPRLGGLAVVGALRAHRPDLPVVVMSGVAPGPRTLRALEEYRTRVLPKPFTEDALRAAVREAVERPRSESCNGRASFARRARTFPLQPRRALSEQGSCWPPRVPSRLSSPRGSTARPAPQAYPRSEKGALPVGGPST